MPKLKLTKEEVSEIRSRYLAGELIKSIVLDYPVAMSTVTLIVHNQRHFDESYKPPISRFRTVFTDEDRTLIVGLYDEGLTPKEIAEKFECAERTIADYLRKTCDYVSPFYLSVEECSSIRTLHKHGYTPKEIGEYIGRPTPTITSFLKRSSAYRK
jgi:uncharacterized protein (DUF433 family)